MPGYWPASICFLSPSPLGPPAMSTKVGTQSRAANSWLYTVSGLMWPGQRMTAGFVGAPVLAAPYAQHGLVFRRQHGHDVHARRVVPDEEGLAGLLGMVAVEEVDDFGRNLLVHCLRAL